MNFTPLYFCVFARKTGSQYAVSTFLRQNENYPPFIWCFKYFAVTLQRQNLKSTFVSRKE
jgi:hypothetical protein